MKITSTAGHSLIASATFLFCFTSLIKNYLSIGDKKNPMKVWERLANVAPMGQDLLFLEFKDFPGAVNKCLENYDSYFPLPCLLTS